MFNNPYNLFGKWLQLQRIQQQVVMLGGCLFLLSYPSWQAWQHWQHRIQLEQQVQQQKEDSQHQQKIQQALSHHYQQQQLSPELASKLAPLNQKIQQLISDYPQLQLEESQWQFTHRPLLKLQIQGVFAELEDFLQRLLQLEPQFHLSYWQIQQLEPHSPASIRSEILFQLHKE